MRSEISHFLLEIQKNDNRHLLIVSHQHAVVRGLSSTHNTKIRIKIYNLYMCGLIYIDDVTNLHSQDKKLIRGRIYTTKAISLFLILGLKIKFCLSESEYLFSFYIFIFIYFFSIYR